MKIINSRPVAYRLSAMLRSLIDRIENNNNLDFDTNGENFFLNCLIENFVKKNELIFFDIGANEGKYTNKIIELLNKKNVIDQYKLHVFEPTKSSFDKLSTIFSSNPNVLLNKSGLSDRSGIQEIYYDREGSQLASLLNRDLSHYGKKLNFSENVTLLRLDEYILQNNITHIHLLKIDVEGVELQVLKGMGKYLTPTFVDFIQFEYGGTNLDSKTSLREFYTLLNTAGFKIAKLLPRSLWERDYLPSHDNFQYSNFIAFPKNLNR